MKTIKNSHTNYNGYKLNKKVKNVLRNNRTEKVNENN